MAVNLSPVGGVAAQFFTNTGAVLTGGKIYTYLAGTTTPATTYTSSQGTTPWTNPIVLDAAGRVSGSGEIWLTDGINYKFVLKDSNDVLIATYDNITGINSNSVAYTNSQEIVTATAGQTVFNLGISYQPGTNSLSVFVDGVNQYGPSASYAYVETDSDTVTFNSGLHVGAVVKFTTTQQQGAGATDASQVSYTPGGVGAVTTNVQAKLRQTVSVMDYVTSGAGTSGDPYLGWDTNTPWAAGIEVVFPTGTFAYSTTLNLAYSKIYVHGAGRATILKFNGTGNCVSFDGGGSGINSPHIEGFLITGNASATNGIYTDNATYGICKNITVQNVSAAGFRSIFGVYWHIENFYMGNNFGAQTTTPTVGIYLGNSGGSETVTAYTIVNANIADCVNSGIDINNGWMNTIVGGAVEANGDQGLYLGVNAHDNLINGLYIEGNATKAAYVQGAGNNFVGLWCVDATNPPIVFSGSTSANHVYGGVYGAITIDSGATRNEFTNTRLEGTWTDNGNGTAVSNVFSDNLAAYIHPTFVASWTNNATYPYETFTSSGSSITSAINSSGLGVANSNSFYLVGGATYIFQWFVTLNSGTLPGFVVSSNTAASATGVSVAGNNTYMFKANSSGTYYFTLRTESGVAANYAVSNVDVKQIN